MNTAMLKIINQVFEMEKKAQGKPEFAAMERHIDRIKTALEEMGLSYHNPAGEKYSETRTDCEANIVGELKSDMVITDVVKPVIFEAASGSPAIIQKAVVLVENVK